ncbi:hypothetical protein INR49_002609 [Caranx melampygus]|nr:hypothetical protein INR49_002609 [Caranx melampygus]
MITYSYPSSFQPSSTIHVTAEALPGHPSHGWCPHQSIIQGHRQRDQDQELSHPPVVRPVTVPTVPAHELHLPATAEAAPTDTPVAPTTPSSAPAFPPSPRTGAKTSTAASKPPATKAAPAMTLTSPAARLTSGPPTVAPNASCDSFATKKAAVRASRDDSWFMRLLTSSLG